MLKSKILVRWLHGLAVAASVAGAALPASGQTYQVANSTDGRQVSASPINAIVNNLNVSIAETRGVANYAVVVGEYAQNTAVVAYDNAVAAHISANYAHQSAVNAYDRANESYQHATNVLGVANSYYQDLSSKGNAAWNYIRDTHINLCYTQATLQNNLAMAALCPSVAPGSPY